jgi:hypothetical protein
MPIQASALKLSDKPNESRGFKPFIDFGSGAPACEIRLLGDAAPLFA